MVITRIKHVFSTLRRWVYDPPMPTEPVKGRMYTIQEAADAMGMTRQRLHVLIQQGRVTAHRFGRVWMVPEDAIGKIEPGKPTGRPRIHKRRE